MNVGNTLFALVWVLNFAISVWNAYAVGKVWVEARVAGGWHRLMCWIGAIMSACGFTWCYLSFLALTAHHFGWLTDEQVLAASLGNFLGGRQRERGRDGDGGGGVIVVLLLVAFALLAGVLSTAVIIRRLAATEPLPPRPTGEQHKVV
jgi:hypothetical protein